MGHHVLVPVNDSEPAFDALSFALTEFPDATITVLHVIDPSDLVGHGGIEGGAMVDYDAVRSMREEMAEALIERAEAEAEARDSPIESHVEFGQIDRRIVEFAEEHDVDQIVIGSHGRTGASWILLGSVAERVVRRAHVPVTVVR